MRRSNQQRWWRALVVVVATLAAVATASNGQAKKPNILVIFGDDIGQTDISAYSMGLMGFHTPNIDRIAREGMMFTDYYAENSCTAGRATVIVPLPLVAESPKRATGVSSNTPAIATTPPALMRSFWPGFAAPPEQ